MQKLKFRNFHKQKYTLLSKKYATEKHSGQQPNTTQKLRQMPGKTPMWGNPMRERSYYYASGKYKTAANPHFQPRKILHNTKFVP